jgi:hypothetical protein
LNFSRKAFTFRRAEFWHFVRANRGDKGAEAKDKGQADEDWEYFGCAVLFTGKCDNRGGWKVTKSRLLSDAEDKKISEAGD